MNRLVPVLRPLGGLILPLGLLLSACESVTPAWDQRFGDAVRDALARQVIDPEAGLRPDPVSGIDGKASRESMLLYQGTWRQPPPVVNVINIGGRLGTPAPGQSQ
jgi:hypothetical protein